MTSHQALDAPDESSVVTATHGVGPAEPRFVRRCLAAAPPAGMAWRTGWFRVGRTNLYGISLVRAAA